MRVLVAAVLALGLLPAVATAALRPGIDADPHRLTITDGNGFPTPWYPIGYSPGLGALVRRCDGVSRDRYYVDLHNWLRSRGIRSYRTVFTFGQPFDGSSQCPTFTETLPYRRNGSGLHTAADGGEPFDLTSFDDSHFTYWQDVIADAAGKGIVVQLNIFETWHLDEYEHSGLGWGAKFDFYDGRNNTSGADFDPRKECTWFETDPKAGIYIRQRELVWEVVRRLGGFENLILEIANEPGWRRPCNSTVDRRASAWVAAMQGELAEAVRALYPNVPHLTVPGDIPEHRDILEGDHEAESAHDKLVTAFSLNKPLIAHNDCGCLASSADKQRERGWAVLTAGAHIDYFFNLERAADFAGGKPADEAAEFLGYIGTFLDLTGAGSRLRGMRPLDGSLTTPVLPGEKTGSWAFGRASGNKPEYIVYKRALGNENSWFTLDNAPSRYEARWFDPRTGMMDDEEQAVGVPVAGGGLKFERMADPTSDWVLHLIATPDLEVFVPDEPILVIVPNGGSFTFPPWSLGGAPAAASFEICNSGSATLTVDDPASLISGLGFSQASPAPAATMAPGACTSLHVEFQASASGSYAGSVSIASDAGNGPPYTFSLLATAGDAEIRVRTSPQGVGVSDGGVYTFPTRSLGQLPVSQLFDLCNDGTDPLTIGNPTTLVGGFGFAQIDIAPASAVAAGTCTTFRVRFNVGAAGTYNGSVSITNNDGDENPFDFTVRGTAVANPEIRVVTHLQGANVADGSLYTFPNRSLAQLPVSQLFDLCNDGVDPLTVSNPTSLVAGAGFSQIGAAPSSTVGPGDCTNFRVRFQVSAAGTYSGAVTVTNNDSDENPFDISLSATAVP